MSETNGMNWNEEKAQLDKWVKGVRDELGDKIKMTDPVYDTAWGVMAMAMYQVSLDRAVTAKEANKVFLDKANDIGRGRRFFWVLDLKKGILILTLYPYFMNARG